MNIVFFTQEDPFYVKVFFDEFLKLFKPLEEIRAVVISRPMGKKSILKLAAQMFSFYGFNDFIKVGLRYTYVKLMGKRKIRENGARGLSKTYTVKQLANACGLIVIERSDLNSKAFMDMIGQYNPDLFVSVACPNIFKEDLIKIPRLGSINVHHAPLPRYRGMLPSFWQLYHGEKEAGITIHRIDEGIDTGDIIVQHSLPIYPKESLDELILRTKRESARLMVKVIDSFRKGEVQYRKMEGGGSYFTFPGREDVREFKRMGKRLL
jgi:methionyl-tRNA formyltransferase